MEGMAEGWGRLVAVRRAELTLTQEDLARMTGLTQATISRIESGSLCPKDRVKWLLAGALRRTLDDLFPWPKVMPPPPDRMAA